MSNPLSFARERRRDDEGFTLIELLVVVVILGILIGIAIPVYLNYRKSAQDKAAQSDLRGAISAFEVCNSDNAGYPSSVPTTGGALTAAANGCVGNIPLSSGTTIKYVAGTGTPASSYLVFARNANGSGSGADARVYCYNSATGGGVKQTQGDITALTACPAS